LKIHANSNEDAFNWLARTFDGIDMSLRTCSIVNCDVLVKFQNINGKRFVIEKPEGYYRTSHEEVAIGLYKLTETLKRDYERCLYNVKRSPFLHEKIEKEYYLDYLNASREGARCIKTWLINLLKEIPFSASRNLTVNNDEYLYSSYGCLIWLRNL
jgi:hypothetical protein